MVNRKFYNFLGIVLLVLFGVGILCGLDNSPSPMKFRRAVSNYRACAGIDYSGEISYGWLVSQYGEPDEIKMIEETNGYRIFVSYGQLSFKFFAEDDTALKDHRLWRINSLITTNPEHCFGRKKIHVGSSRDEVIKAYKKSTAAYSDRAGEGYIEGDWDNFVKFTYDEENVVTSIEFYHKL